MKQPRSHLVLAFLASGVLYWVLDLSRSRRTAIDWAVVGLVTTALLHNLVQLGRRLHRVAGPRAVWHELRTIGFWVIGLLNTALARPEHVGTWRYVVGWLLVAIAVADSVALYHKELSHRPQRARARPEAERQLEGPNGEIDWIPIRRSAREVRPLLARAERAAGQRGGTRRGRAVRPPP